MHKDTYFQDASNYFCLYKVKSREKKKSNFVFFFFQKEKDAWELVVEIRKEYRWGWGGY